MSMRSVIAAFAFLCGLPSAASAGLTFLERQLEEARRFGTTESQRFSVLLDALTSDDVRILNAQGAIAPNAAINFPDDLKVRALGLSPQPANLLEAVLGLYPLPYGRNPGGDPIFGTLKIGDDGSNFVSIPVAMIVNGSFGSERHPAFCPAKIGPIFSLYEIKPDDAKAALATYLDYLAFFLDHLQVLTDKAHAKGLQRLSLFWGEAIFTHGGRALDTFLWDAIFVGFTATSEANAKLQMYPSYLKTERMWFEYLDATPIPRNVGSEEQLLSAIIALDRKVTASEGAPTGPSDAPTPAAPVARPAPTFELGIPE